MKNTLNRQSRHTRSIVRVAALVLCLGVAPMAFAQSGQDSVPQGAGYLLSYGSNYQHVSGFHGGGIGGYSSSRDVPEPATWGMFGLGLAMIGMGVASRRRRRARLTHV